MSPRDILIAARAKIEKPECWTRKSLARNANGWPVKPWDGSAVCWCSLGAIDSQCPQSSARVLAIRALSRATGCAYESMDTIADYNDSESHAKVLAAFDRAIADLEEQS